MSSNPGGPDDNPFKGTPFEQIFNALGGSGGLGALGGQGGGQGGMPDLSALMGQMQAMMAPYDGPVNWTLATDIAGLHERSVERDLDAGSGEWRS